ncbi:MAG: hypothetical protein AAFZ65_16590 [Planctomycetota bacterium]
MTDTRIDTRLLDRPVLGRHLAGERFRDQLDPDRPTLVAFVRHFG